MSAERPSTVSSKELMRLTGATFRQIDYWHRTGWVLAHERLHDLPGYPRAYEESEIQVVRLLVAISDADMLSSGRRGRQVDLTTLIAYVRENGLVGDWDITDYLTLHLSEIREQQRIAS